ncbi:hypothetical protein GGR50DRAFT_687190 [Xylaria sp. CBS 124048]|nr:hypothetical protein GGR50DRAFT_687190 [Xylaria sp. CBS 124048]
MKRGQFSLTNLPAWCALNNITFAGVSAADIEDRGLGLIAEKDLNVNNGDLTLLKIPGDLVVSAVGVENYAKENQEFRMLLDAAGHQSLRGDILLFLLIQFVLSSPDYKGGLGPTTAWAQYFKLLPIHVPAPTLWSESELSLLRGTSLEPAVRAKTSALASEFNRIRDATARLPRWNEILEHTEAITLHDWVWLDALYRSRSLALPKSGESMVPCLDLVNHSRAPTAYFHETSEDEAVLLLHDGANVLKQDELTIDYGHEKSAAEMLFSYGFIDSESTAQSIVLPIKSMDDDPLAKAKLLVYGTRPTLKITDNDNGIPQWDAPFVQLMCLNDEDGLHFKVLRETDGSQHLRMLWQDTDVTEEAGHMETLIKGHGLCQVFRLRAVAVVFGMIQQQLETLATSDEESLFIETDRPEIVRAASQLRALERDLLGRICEVVESEKSHLFEDESVKAYLSEMNGIQHEDGVEDDFT